MTEQSGSRLVRSLLALVVAGLVAMWAYVVYLAVFEGRAESPDKLDDPAFAAAAERECAAVLGDVNALPRAETQQDDPVGRAATVETANRAYRDMIDAIGAIGAIEVDGDDATLVGKWLADWRRLLDDRDDFVRRLRENDDARLLITAGPSGRQITLRIDEFATTNDMASCASPRDA